MATSPHRALRLEPEREHDTADAAATTVHDPLWFLARQWQLGEFQGENASTPVLVTLRTRERPLMHAAADPATTPAEALIESEQDDWWTMGRRIRVGRSIEHDLNPALTAKHRFRMPPPPYDGFEEAPDGLAIWHDRDQLELPDAVFGGVGVDTPSAWNETDLWYEQTGAFTSPGFSLDVVRHGGGRVDWFTVDAVPDGEAGDAGVLAERMALPARLVYPGMPLLNLWEIEDPDDDVGAIAPDSSHSPTAIMTELFFSHRDEWFQVPVGGRAGSILSIEGIEVRDSFGERYTDATEPGLRPPLTIDDVPWTLFATRGLAPHDLVLWHVAELPLESDALERVQLGIDEAANLVWAVERRLDGKDAPPDPPVIPAGVTSLVPTPPGDLEAAVDYVYVPGEGAAAGWIPYTLDTNTEGPRSFVQRRLFDLSHSEPVPMSAARATVLTSAGGVHHVSAASVPSGGLELERRWQLARDMDGRPVLWIQRQRRQLLAPPARRLVFDVAEPGERL